jgi:hypothetical protein
MPVDSAHEKIIMCCFGVTDVGHDRKGDRFLVKSLRSF